MNRDAYFDPNPYYGEISSAAFRYVGTEYIIVDLGKFRGFDSSAGNTDITYNIIYITLSSIVSQVAIDRLALDIDGRIYQWSDASLLEGRRLLLWDDEDVIFVDGQTVAVKLIETGDRHLRCRKLHQDRGRQFQRDGDAGRLLREHADAARRGHRQRRRGCRGLQRHP